jgi:ribosomal protein RSM22 (predicted rRNA methylase)
MIATPPPTLSRAIDAELATIPAARLRAAAEALSHAYRSRRVLQHALSPAERAAYLAVRFPSTFAVALTVWREFARVSPAARVASVLDAGAGPGTASLAAIGILNLGTRYTWLERDAGWRDAAARLAAACELRPTLLQGAIAGGMKPAPHDVVIASYALNELDAGERNAAVQALWQSAKYALIVVEPGTPAGFEIVRSAREGVLSLGGHAAGPCTHDASCPMSTTDWCHRPQRVMRTPAHRAAKRAQLGFEDEKFSFVILTREPPDRSAAARIVRKPIRAAGHVHLDLCAGGALSRVTVARSDGPAYRDARKVAWGDAWPPHDD